ncbi:hypothetical protein OG612_00415 [Streptomyces sp. NBC_01527]|uniref:hypothetical protein n=1 Tax=Streptomyces sp. NBC_01527 TaxID=2903894 RepID=UPI003870EC11
MNGIVVNGDAFLSQSQEAERGDLPRSAKVPPSSDDVEPMNRYRSQEGFRHRGSDRTRRLAACVLALAGVALMSVDALVFVVGGLSVLVIGFFIIHGLASGWVTARARAAGISTGQAASFYLVSFYIGSSMFGNLGSTAWSHAGWPGVLALAGSLLTVASMLAWGLRRTSRR